jgi:hypothetical protein
VFSWVTAINTRGTNVLSYQPVMYTFLGMSSLKKRGFPFSSLHANAGAHLKAKILLLHPTLCNPQEGDGVDLSNVPNVADSLVELYAGSGGENSGIHSMPSSVNHVPPLVTDPVATTDLGTESDVDSSVA